MDSIKNLLLLLVIIAGALAYVLFEQGVFTLPTFSEPTPEVSEVPTTPVNVFFLNTKNDPGMTDCTAVFSVERDVPATEAVGNAALDELLKGPSADDIRGGFVTAINPGVVVNSLRIEGGIAYADFSGALSYAVAGSCRVGAIRAEIESTLKQFPTVTSVVISVDGVTDGVLQP